LVLSNTIGKAISDKVSQMRGTSLKARCTRSTMVLFVATFGERVLKLVRNMILARLLAPEDFGLMAIVLTASILLQALSDVGVRQSVIHNKRGLEYEYLNMAWWLQTIRGLALFAIAFLIAPFISSFYGKPELTLFLRIACVVAIFNGLISPRTYAVEKELRFSRWVFIYQGGAVSGTVVAIMLAFWVRNVWALVIGFTVEAISCCLLSFILCPFWPRLRIDRQSLRELLRYAHGMFGVTLLTIVALQTDVIVLGKVVSAEQLGMYALALALAKQPSTMFGQTIARVLLSAFAEKQDENIDLCNALLRMIKFTVLIGVPSITLAVILAGPILSVIYGPKYAAVAFPFSIMCCSMLFRIQKTIVGTMYLAIGKPNLHRRFVLIMSTIILVSMYPGIRLLGLAGAATVLLFADILGLYMHVVRMPGLIGLRLKNYASCWLPCVWVLPIMVWPIVILRPIGVNSIKIKTLLAILGLFISYLIYFKPRFCRKKPSPIS